MTFVSYAQNFEDVLLWRAFAHLGTGFYIDVGAAHPDTDSVTRAFYDRGWTGVNIEPVAELFVRIEASRPRDVNLNVALGESAGHAAFFVIPGTGLSTLDASVAENCRGQSFEVERKIVEVRTLADICAQHATGDIHFLKIDVEGAERAVLTGADLHRFRPRIVLLEATAPMSTVESHGAWEPDLLACGYRFLWFDGLNRFYAAEERYDELAPHFRVPVNVFDGSLRASDTECAGRIAAAEAQSADLLERAMTAEAELAKNAAASIEERIRGVEGRIKHAEAQAEAAGTRAFIAESRLTAELQERIQLQGAIGELRQLRVQARAASDLVESYRASTSWRLTAPMRQASVLARGVLRRVRSRSAGAPSRQPSLPPPSTAPVLLTRTAEGGQSIAHQGLRRSVHQFHSGSAVGDAITNAMLLMQRQLRAMGYRSEIYVEHRDLLLEAELLTLDELPDHGDYVLIVHHSMGFDAFARVAALPAPKVLMYHNITPAALFPDQPELQHYSQLGRQQLSQWRPLVAAALADSEFNAIELRTLGFDSVAVCTMLFDIAVLRARAGFMPPRGQDVFTILFVGRVIASKAQSDLIGAYSRFRDRYRGASRLVLVGSHDGGGETYFTRLQIEVVEHGIGQHVLMTGKVSDDELYGWYRAADLYVSLSHHEGFGVPLVEAMALGVPVLAWPAGAVPFTIAGGGELLHDREPEAVAARMLALADDTLLRAQIVERQRETVERFAIEGQKPALLRALALAGAAPPADPATAAMLAGNLRFTVTGHLAGSYSLAAINRSLALSLEAAFPARVRLLPVAGEQLSDPSSMPACEFEAIQRLARLPMHDTGPHIVISQHYPILVPEEGGDVSLAMVFWEESLLPQATIELLNASFRAVLAPSRFVAKALVDSGLSIPVAAVGFAPDLHRFEALGNRGRTAAEGRAFTFLHVSSCFPRKGIPALLAAYVAAFRNSDAVRLVIKGFPNPHNDAAAQVEALRLDDPGAPDIVVIDRDLDASELAGLYEAADVMVLPTHGEGFNLPAAEALAAGLPLIVTGFGGHMDFCDRNNARLVDYRFAPSGSHLATAGSVWVEPNVADLEAALKEAISEQQVWLARAEAARHASTRRFEGHPFAQGVAEEVVACLLMPPDRALHVAIISSWGVRCGVAEYSRFLVEAMRQADAALRVTVFADKRTPPAPAGEGAIAVRPVWQLGLQPGVSGNARALCKAIAVADPDAVILQHQPGLIPWGSLGSLVPALVAGSRTVTVTLHNTRNLLDVDEAERRCALDGLALASRTVVHTVADLNLLKHLGLVANVALLPQGAPEPAQARAIRPLTPSNPSSVVIGCCGFFLPGKGIGQLIEAVALIRSRWPQVRLRLVNADYGSKESAAEIAACRAAARNAGVASAVEWNTDYLPIAQLRGKLDGCDIVVLPYQDTKEASSAALRTALGAGVCVAVTPIPIFDEAAQAVFRLPGISPQAMAEGLECLLADKELRAATQEGAKRWLQDRAWNGVGKRMLGMVRGLAR